MSLPDGTWTISDSAYFDEILFPRSVGDPSGYYFPLASKLGVLLSSRQMREESLPLALHSTHFVLDDMDDLLRMLLSIGQIGRSNIRSLEFVWESRTDLENRWDTVSSGDVYVSAMPTLHVTECVDLLKQCSRLQFLRLKFDIEIMANGPGFLQKDPGIEALCSLTSIQKLEVLSFADESIDPRERQKS